MTRIIRKVVFICLLVASWFTLFGCSFDVNSQCADSGDSGYVIEIEKQ